MKRGWSMWTVMFQVERFMKRDHLSKEVAESRLAAQWSLEEKKNWRPLY